MTVITPFIIDSTVEDSIDLKLDLRNIYNYAT